MLMICLEWWAFEIGMITTGLLGKAYLAANTLIMTFGTYAYLILSGVQIGTIILVGNYLGEGKVNKAITVARVALFWGVLSFGTLFFSVFFFLAPYLPYIFTDDKQVISLTSAALPVLAVMQAVDCIVNVASGILKGAGKQLFGAITNFTGYYIVGLPAGICLMMGWGVGLGVPGYWWGQVIGLTIQSTIFMIYLTCKLDWTKAAELAVKRSHSTSNGSNDEPSNGSSNGSQSGCRQYVRHLSFLFFFAILFFTSLILSITTSSLHNDSIIPKSLNVTENDNDTIASNVSTTVVE
jgi:MATE family multidrug resistance protein